MCAWAKVDGRQTDGVSIAQSRDGGVARTGKVGESEGAGEREREGVGEKERECV